MDDFILGLTGVARPRVCFVPTATGDADSVLVRFYEAFPARRCRASHLPLVKRHLISDLRTFLLEQDVIYVGGGNTILMLAAWRAFGVDQILREAWEAGVILCGLSAGSLCWFETGPTDVSGRIEPLDDCLGFLPGSHCPHYDGEEHRRPGYHRLIAEGMPPGYAADDGAALHFIGTALEAAVSSRANAHAYRVEFDGTDVTETCLPSLYLDSPG